LTTLAKCVTELLEGEALDPRFARKLLKRISNEAEAVGDEAIDDPALDAALQHLGRAVDGVQAQELVEAAAALRADEEGEEQVASGDGSKSSK
jgi:Holliday junction resolvasome RuvABC ATP-dependent DNA helicase subunit